LRACFQQREDLKDTMRAPDEATWRPTPTVTVTVTVPAQGGSTREQGSGSSSGGAAGSYLSDLRTVGRQTTLSKATGNILAKAYPHSVGLLSATAQATYPVSGASRLTGRIGIADQASSASGVIADVGFFDLDGKRLGQQMSVSLGRPQPVDVFLAGVVQMKVTCSARDQGTGAPRNVYTTLGDAKIGW
jgi:hypothetical protein